MTKLGKESQMDLWEAIKERRSIRRYAQGRDVPPETVEQLLQAAIAAPSAGNCQPWHFVVVRDVETKQGLAQAAYGQQFVAQAPVVIVVCADPPRSASRYGRRGGELYCLQDTAAAAENILLGVTALGLGACWVGAFDEGAAAQVLDLPSHLRPVVLIPIGHPAERFARRTPRRSWAELTTFIT
jgi:nitroreductase